MNSRQPASTMTGLTVCRRAMHALWYALLLQPFPTLQAADGPSTPVQLEEIIVTSTRIDEAQASLPVAVSTVGERGIQLGRQQLGLDEALFGIPGVFFQNRYNFAQDARISIRGFGARANFGIRGIRILADGIPQTLPDGQSSVDAIDLGSAERIEVIRGSAASAYGAASGGVINITTGYGPSPPEVSARLNAGSYGFLQGQLKAGGQTERLNYLANATATTLDGYRKHSTYRSGLFNSRFRYDLDDSSEFSVTVNALDSPKARDPGALTRAEVNQDRKQAAPRNVLFDAGEEIDQQTLGLGYDKRVSDKHEFSLRNYYVLRDFRNRLPFSVNSNGQGGSVKLDRFFTGGGGNYNYTGDLLERSNRLVLGFDIDAQRDHRKRFANNQGSLGEKTTDQDEDVSSYGIYAQNVLAVTGSVALTLGLRYDGVHYDVKDHTGNDGSSDISFTEFNPMAGVSWNVRPSVNLYANIARSFDPPTTTELANPQAASGFNSDLKPQTAVSYEIGAKGLLPGRLRYELALFHIDVDDQLVRFELAGAGQSFFENAGSSTHNGLEAGVSMELFEHFSGTLSYTWSDFSFDSFRTRDGDEFDGNKIPGVPDNQFSLALEYSNPAGYYLGWDWLYAGSFYADNANSVKSGDYSVSNLRAGARGQWQGLEISPFIGINNLFNEEYFDNVRLNAGFGRYFEPAPKRNYYGGIELTYRLE